MHKIQDSGMGEILEAGRESRNPKERANAARGLGVLVGNQRAANPTSARLGLAASFRPKSSCKMHGCHCRYSVVVYDFPRGTAIKRKSLRTCRWSFRKGCSRIAPSMCRPPLWSRENETTVPHSHLVYTRQDLRHLRTPQLHARACRKRE